MGLQKLVRVYFGVKVILGSYVITVPIGSIAVPF